MSSETLQQFIAIDLKSFYASVECVERGLNPLDACLLVADQTRTAKTICLAVSPALKAFGVPGRPRLFEAIQVIREANSRRGRVGVAGWCGGRHGTPCLYTKECRQEAPHIRPIPLCP